MLALIEKNPKDAATTLGEGVTVLASPVVLRGVRATGFGQVGEDGEVETSALTGLEEALIVMCLVALASGFGLGCMKGKEDGLEEGASDEAEDEGSGDGGDSGTGDGDDGGDGEGGEGGPSGG